MAYRDHSVRDPNTCGGQPIIRGTRVPLRRILARLARGETIERIVEEFPMVTAEDVRAAIAFAASSAAEDLPAPSPIPPHRKELTPQQAADVLNVSTQYLVHLLDQGKLAHTQTGEHRHRGCPGAC
jgi:excisionase family DNA binding protein